MALFWTLALPGSGQIREIVTALRAYDLDRSEELVTNQDTAVQKELLWQIEFLEHFSSDLPQPSTDSSNSLLGRVYHHINMGDYLFFTQENQYLEARAYYIQAIELALAENSQYLVCAGLRKLLLLYSTVFLDDNETIDYYLGVFEKYAFDSEEENHLSYYRLLFDYYHLPQEISWNEALANQLLDYTNDGRNPVLSAQIFFLLGGYQHDYLESFENAVALYLEGLTRISGIETGIAPFIRKRLYTGLIRCFILEGQVDTAVTLIPHIQQSGRNIHEENYRRFYHFYQSSGIYANNNNHHVAVDFFFT